MTLISSKRVIEKQYTEFDVIGRLLKTRSNLGVMIEKNKEYTFKLIDPLGNIFCNTRNISELCNKMLDRVLYIRKLTRLRSRSIGPQREFKVDNEFISLIHEYGEIFTKYINAVNKDRFLGNASIKTRCMSGFPAEKQKDRILVSKRNVNKENISDNDFVEVINEDKEVLYYGDQKPSVDTPIQVKLFNHYKNIKYMIHGHVYVDSEPTTENKIPCGYIEEFEEIKELFGRNESKIVINLKGHGFLIMSDDISFIREYKDKLKSRPFLEH